MMRFCDSLYGSEYTGAELLACKPKLVDTFEAKGGREF